MMHTGAVILRRHCRTSRLTQIAVIFLFWLTGEAVTRLTGLPIPGGIFGLFILLGLLIAGRLNVRTVRLGAGWFLGEMLLFFVPAVLVVLDHPEFMGVLGLKIVAVILLGTLTVMTVTAVVVDAGYKLMLGRRKKRIVL